MFSDFIQTINDQTRDQKFKEALNDADTVEEALEFFIPKKDANPKTIQRILNRLPSIIPQLKLSDSTPNNNQLAVGLAIFHRFVTYKSKPF